MITVARRALGILAGPIIFGWALTFAQQPTSSPSPTPPECNVPAYKAAELDSKAKILDYPHPDFSEADVQRHKNSVIVLRGLLCGSGKVTDLKVIQGVSDRADEEAIKTAKRIKFKPALKDGREASQWVQFEYRLRVSDIRP